MREKKELEAERGGDALAQQGGHSQEECVNRHSGSLPSLE